MFLNLLAGCLISGGIELASQMIIEGKSLECVDWWSVAMETATGCNPFSKWKKVSKVVEGAQCILGNSLVAGTLVHTDQGLKPIETVKVGEKVLSFNERTGQNSYAPVQELIQHEGTFQLVKVTLDSGESLEATAGHPFYIQGKGWNVAANLKVGEAVRLSNGTTLVVKTVDTSTRVARVYNFSVAGNANYFVGKDGVLVHNAEKCRDGLPFTRKGRRDVIEENRDRHDGNTVCEYCGVETVPAKKSEKGVTPPSNETHVDHVIPQSKGGAGDPSNGQVLCRFCNLRKSNK